jgi:hypothetical protein
VLQVFVPHSCFLCSVLFHVLHFWQEGSPPIAFTLTSRVLEANFTPYQILELEVQLFLDTGLYLIAVQNAGVLGIMTRKRLSL